MSDRLSPAQLREIADALMEQSAERSIFVRLAAALLARHIRQRANQMFKDQAMTSDKEEFCARFKARMIEIVGPSYSQLDEDGRPAEEGLSTAEYADEAAPTYWDDPMQREEGPEACAEADYSCWGD